MGKINFDICVAACVSSQLITFCSMVQQGGRGAKGNEVRKKFTIKYQQHLQCIPIFFLKKTNNLNRRTRPDGNPDDAALAVEDEDDLKKLIKDCDPNAVHLFR